MTGKEAVEALKTAKWRRIPGQNLKVCEIGPWKFHAHDDGGVSVSENRCWISALFETPEDAASWADNYVEAELKFRDINVGKPDGIRDYVPARRSLEN
jgi:hypothetical protein